MSRRLPRISHITPDKPLGLWSYYVPLSGVCFTVGACMELFMIKTGFYEKVVVIEAENRAEGPPAWAAAFQDAKDTRSSSSSSSSSAPPPRK